MPELWKFECMVPEELHQMRADAILAKIYPMYSRNQWIEWLRADLIQTNQTPLSPKHKLNEGTPIYGEVPIQTQQVSAKGEDIPLNIIYEDDDLLVINKPAGLVVHPGAGQPNQTLMNALLHHQPSLETLPRAGIVHRLDKDTTGLMVIAKSQIAYLALVDMMQQRNIQRSYFALVHGIIHFNATISTHYGRSTKNRLKMSVRNSGKIAVTHYLVQEKFKQNTLLDVSLETGRTHQIRVHLSHINHPIVGDRLYGKSCAPGKGTIAQALNDFPRQALHAYHLKFIHPITQNPLTFEAVLPDDFALLLETLRQ